MHHLTFTVAVHEGTFGTALAVFFIYAVKTGVFKLGTEYFIERLKR